MRLKSRISLVITSMLLCISAYGSNRLSISGPDSSAYGIRRNGPGYEATNARQRLAARFTPKGVSVAKGSARWAMELRAYGYGTSLRAVQSVAPRTASNRLEYKHQALTE